MERRDFLLKSLFKSSTTNAGSSPPPPPPPSETGLDAYTGVWDKQHVSQFLSKTIFGATYQKITDIEELGLNDTVQMLLQDVPIPAPPVNPDFEEDPFVPIGESWVDQPHAAGINAIKSYRRRSLDSWTMENINNQSISIFEKMVLFWHNHFVTSDIMDARFRYRYITTIRQHAMGDFRQFVKDISIDPSMLRYLNGRENTKSSPNENYARELMELFTIGKGPQIAPGDYTNYSEEDVLILAKILTGWRDRGYYTADENIEIGAFFIPNRHDTSTKTMTSHFNNTVIENAGEDEINILIDVILAQEEVSKFIVRQLYIWFLYKDITDFVEENIIVPLAQIFRDNDYQIKPVLEIFLKSEHFNDFENQGAIIKNPIDLSMSLCNQFDIEMPTPLGFKYDALRRFSNFASGLGMQYYGAPTVAGWSAYYQEPSYYRTWINSVTLVKIQNFRVRLLNNGFAFGDFRVKIDSLKFANTLSNPAGLDELIADCILVLLPKSLQQNQIDYIKEEFFNDLVPSAAAWTVLYNNYLANPDDEALVNQVSARLGVLLKTITGFPEYLLG